MSDNRGRSPLLLSHPKFPVKGLIKTYQSATVIRGGNLDLFGNPKSEGNVIKIMRLPKRKIWRTHIINGPGLNNGRPQPHEITRGFDHDSLVRAIQRGDARFLDAFRRRCKVVAKVFAEAPAGTLEPLVSPWLEHRPIPEEVFRTLARIISEEIPAAEIVDNPVEGGFIRGFLRERHNDVREKVDIVDLDGVDWEDLDLRSLAERHSSAKMVLIWGWGENGLDPKADWQVPQRRTAWTAKRELKMFRYFVRPDALDVRSPLNPKDLQGLRRRATPDGWKRDFVWKLGDGKDYATALFPTRFSRFKKVVIVKDGRVIDRGRYRGLYMSDGSRRQIWDFRRHIVEYPDNCVIRADRDAWVLEKPAFRID